MTSPEQQLSQRPDLGVETITPAEPIMLTQEQFPWLNAEETTLNTVSVQLEGLDAPFRYGSAISGNNSLEKIADSVSVQNSINAEQGMFKALSSLLRNQTAPTVDVIPDVSDSFTLYKTSKRGKDVARLFFTVIRDEHADPVVIKLGIAPHKKQQAMIGVLRQEKNNRRKKNNS